MRFRVFKVENISDYLLTAFLLVCALSLAINHHQGGINTIRQLSLTAVSLLEEPLSSIRVYRQALNTNNYLQRQNILLQDELSRLRAIESENVELRQLLELRATSSFDLEPVTFVSKRLTGLNNIFTIDAGEKDGIALGMPVLTSDGLIGKIVLVNTRHSQVMPYYNNFFRVSARVQETQSTGIVSWKGDNMSELVLDFIPKTISVDSGFVIETSGFGNEYPGGIPIGSVTRSEEDKGKDTQRIYITPFTSLIRVSEGFVVKFAPDTAIQNLNDNYNDLFR